jgi:hypothetical protein
MRQDEMGNAHLVLLFHYGGDAVVRGETGDQTGQNREAPVTERT